MIRIIQIIPNLRKGGAERLVLDICNAIQKQPEVRVKLVTFSDHNEYVELSKKVDWTVIPSYYTPSISGESESDVSELKCFINEFHPDIIHTHLWEAEMVARQIKFPKAKWFSHFHDNMVQLNKLGFPFKKEKLTNYYERQLMLRKYKSIDNKFICISNNTLKYANKVLPKSLNNKTYLLSNGVDINRFSISDKKSKTDEVLKLISVGSLVKNKNHFFLIKVSNYLQNCGVNFQLDILGNGEEREGLENHIFKNKLIGKVQLHGNVDNPECFYQKAHLYVHSSYSEALGLTIIEAMAAGLPVVTLDGGGNRDLIEQGKNGFMVFEEDVELFAKHILELWKDKSKYDEMSAYAKEFAKQYDIQAYCNKLLKLYKEA